MRFPYLLALLAVAACGTPYPTVQTAGQYPTDYRAALQAHVRDAFFDPYSIRDVAVGEPFLGRTMGKTGWMVCMASNARNQMGGYTGRAVTGYLIRDGQVIDAVPGHIDCKGKPLEPWPEIAGQV